MGFPRSAGAWPRAAEAATLAGAEPSGAPSLEDRVRWRRRRRLPTMLAAASDDIVMLLKKRR